MFETDKLDSEKAVQMCQVMESTMQQMSTRPEPQPGVTKPVEVLEWVAAVSSCRPIGGSGEKSGFTSGWCGCTLLFQMWMVP